METQEADSHEYKLEDRHYKKIIPKEKRLKVKSMVSTHKDNLKGFKYITN